MFLRVNWRDGFGTLEKGPLECGLSKPIMGFQSPSWAFVSRKMTQKSGGHFSEKKKAPAATYPQVQGFQKYEGHFSEKKKLRQRSQPLRASKKSGTIFQKYVVQKPAKRATDLSCNGHQKIHLVQKPFRLLFPATISLKSF